MSAIDEHGNAFDPSCPCCRGMDRYETAALCDACTAAALAGIYPHGCDHDLNCPIHGGAA